MRVLLIDVNYGDSSTGKIVQDLSEALLEHGEDPAVCYGRGDNRSDLRKHVYKFGIDVETYLHAALTRVTGYTGCYSPLSTKRLIQYIDKFKPNVIHIHELHAYFVNIAPLLKYISDRRIPVVWTFHCEFMYTGKCGHAYECDGWLRGCGHCPHLHDYVSTLWFDKTAQMLAEKKRLLEDLDLHIVCPSEWLAGRVRQSFLASNEVIVVHNGVDARIFYPRDASELQRDLGIGSNERVVLAVAPDLMDERKGGHWVLDLAKRYEDKQVRFVLVGVEEGTEPTDVGTNVIIRSPIWDKSLLATYYSMADAFVICSKRENYPTTSIEAQACGTPVIGFDTGGTRDTVAESMRSFLVSYGDITALCSALDNLLAQVRAGWTPSLNRFTASDMCSAYIGIYKTLTDVGNYS